MAYDTARHEKLYLSATVEWNCEVNRVYSGHNRHNDIEVPEGLRLGFSMLLSESDATSLLDFCAFQIYVQYRMSERGTKRSCSA